ncbi:MAG TPA: hypothetical protein VGG39_27490 [Polyangiaceae bacterium]|jgi:hypothetical protein
MPKRELTEREFANLRSIFPTLVLDADQWAEHQAALKAWLDGLKPQIG